jgi:hypothetical protein
VRRKNEKKRGIEGFVFSKVFEGVGGARSSVLIQHFVLLRGFNPPEYTLLNHVL